MYFIFPIYTAIFALATVVLVPRREIRRLVVYAILFGPVIDLVAFFLLTKLLGVGGAVNFQPFGFLGYPLFPPIAWTSYFILYFYLLPRQRPWNYVFPLIGASFSVFFSNILVNLNVWDWNYGRVVVPFIIYISWYSIATWGYLRLTQKSNALELKAHVPMKYRLLTAPARKIEPKSKTIKVKKFKKPIKAKKLKH